MDNVAPSRPRRLSLLGLSACVLAIVIGVLLIVRPAILDPTPAAPALVPLSSNRPSGVIDAPARSLTAGDPAPDFELAALTGAKVKLTDLRGHAVLINFWATWCPPCKEEMPLIVSAYNAHQPAGLRVLAIDSTAFDDMDAIRSFVSKYQMNFDVLLDDQDVVSTGWNILGLPSSFFIKPDGTIAAVHIGQMTAEQLNTYLKMVLPN